MPEHDAQATTPEETRQALLDQLAYLMHEAEALEQVVGRVPTNLLERRPPREAWSIKESFGLLATRDEHIYRSWLEQIVAEEDPRFEEPDDEALLEQEAWNERPVSNILKSVQEAREQLIATFEKLPAETWERTARFGDERRDVYALARNIARHDATQLRAMSRRLYDSDLASDV